MSDDEAFPHSEQIFRDAFSLSDPAPELLKLIMEHPTYPAVADMLFVYTCITEENPSRANVLASALVALRDSPNAPKIWVYSLAETIYTTLADLHPRGFELDKESRILGPTNTFLTNSLISGLSFKYNLTTSGDQYGAIVDGLDAKGRSSTSEVLVVGACIQLLTAGSASATKVYFPSANEVATKLKAQQVAGTVRDANGAKLLEVRRDSSFILTKNLTSSLESSAGYLAC
jgi:hypothetical protein